MLRPRCGIANDVPEEAQWLGFYRYGRPNAFRFDGDRGDHHRE